MVRLLLIVIGWPLLVLVLVSGYQWYRATWPEPPAPRAAAVDPAAAAQVGRDALARFARLSPAEQADLVEGLAGAVISPREWLDRLRAAAPDILCVGEMHEPDTRAFLARSLFARYPVDRLLLEVRPAELERIEYRVRSGRDYAPLLDADIGAVLRSARRANPRVEVHGIEERREQHHARQRFEGSRDRSLARNFWAAYEPGARHLVLYGALHCGDEPGWFYRYLREQSPPRAGLRLQNVQVLGAHQFAPLAGFVTFLEHLGVAHEDFVVADTSRLHPHLREWFGLLDQQVFARYETLVVFRAGHDRPARTERVSTVGGGILVASGAAHAARGAAVTGLHTLSGVRWSSPCVTGSARRGASRGAALRRDPS